VTRNAGTSGGAGLYGYGSIVVRNTILWENNTDNYTNLQSGMRYEYCCTTPDPGGVGSMIVTNDPLFVDASAGVFRLQAGSPCIDAGSNAYVCSETDLCGGARMRGSAVDIGAYEYTSLPELYVRTPVLDFGDVLVGDSAELDCDARNVGGGVLTCTLSGVSAPFSSGASTYYLSACSADGVPFTFAPDTEGVHSNMVGLIVGGPGVVLTGTGVPEPVAGCAAVVLALLVLRRAGRSQ
jgi:hypothetical protein